jgi:hypothetical protein
MLAPAFKPTPNCAIAFCVMENATKTVSNDFINKDLMIGVNINAISHNMLLKKTYDYA